MIKTIIMDTIISVIGISLSLISIVVAIIIAVILHKQSKNISSLGESVRLETRRNVLELLQALDNIQFIERGLRQNMSNSIKLDHELNCIERFLCSPASKYVADVLDRRNLEKKGGFKFLLNLLIIIHQPDKNEIVRLTIEELLSLSESDFNAMDTNALNLNRDFCKWFKGETYFNKYARELGMSTSEENYERKKDENFFVWLCEEKHIEDPDVVLFYAVSKNDVELLRKALAKGADQTVTDKMLIEKYQAEYGEFIKMN